MCPFGRVFQQLCAGSQQQRSPALSAAAELCVGSAGALSSPFALHLHHVPPDAVG